MRKINNFVMNSDHNKKVRKKGWIPIPVDTLVGI